MDAKKIEKLNLGCGAAKMAGFLNVDNNPNCHPDVVHDLECFPYPFPDNHFRVIVLDHVIEHLANPLSVMEEVFRIGADGCRIVVKCPHFSCNWLHPGHRSAISVTFFDFFDRNHPERFAKCDFQLDDVKLFWLRNRKDYLDSRNIFVRAINYAINFLANQHIGFTERIWCYWVGGFEEICFKVKTVKKEQ